MKTLNLNANVKIKLTPFGIEWLKKKHDKLRKKQPSVIGEFTPPTVDKDGFSKMQLWEVMNNFGELLYNGSLELPFENNIIQIDEAEFEESK